MACVNADGTLAPVAAQVMRAVAASGSAATAAAIALATGLPLYRARATLRELVTAGFVVDEAGAHRLSDTGRARLAA